MHKLGIKTVTLLMVAASLVVNSSSTTIQAQELPPLTLTTLPPKLELEARSGGKVTGSFNLRNDSLVALPVQLEMMGYGRDESGVVGALDGELGPQFAWVDLPVVDLILDAGEVREITFDILVPDSTLPGSYFITIVCKPVPPPNYFQPHSAHMLGYIGEVIGIHVDREKWEDEASTLFVSPLSTAKIVTYGPVGLSSSLANTSSYFRRLTGTIQIKDMFGVIVREESIEEVILFPGDNLDISEQTELGVVAGEFTAKLNLTNGFHSWTEETSFWVIPIWHIFGIIVSVTVLITITIWLWRRRANLAPAVAAVLGRELGKTIKQSYKMIKVRRKIFGRARRRHWK